MNFNDVAISSRVRLARNFEGIKFPRMLDISQSQQQIDAVCELFADNDEYRLIQIKTIPDIEKLMLVERHLISMDLVKNAEKSAVILKKDETLSIMINEEDHIRLCSLIDGLQLNKASETADEIDKFLASSFKYAYQKQYGFLTACPTNLGTGLRASVMLHLPALKLTNALDSVIHAMTKVGLTVRGLYGEGSEALGDMYQLSNQITLGHTTKEIIKAVNAMVNKIIDNELKARQLFYDKKSIQLEDRIFRSYAYLLYARTISTAECMKLISDLKMGVSLGIFKESNENVLNKLIIEIQPASISLLAGRDSDNEQRDAKRAQYVRKIISDNVKEQGDK